MENREKVVSYLNSKLNDRKLSIDIEKSLYDYISCKTSFSESKKHGHKLFKQKYNYHLRYIISNLEEIKYKIKNNEMVVDYIFEKSSVELFPDNWKEELTNQQEENKFLYQTKRISNTKYKSCFRCNEKNVYVFTKQTRSADEPETVFNECLSCGNKWRS